MFEPSSVAYSNARVFHIVASILSEGEQWKQVTRKKGGCGSGSSEEVFVGSGVPKSSLIVATSLLTVSPPSAVSNSFALLDCYEERALVVV